MARRRGSERTRPLELVGASAGVAIFIGLVVLLSTRDLVVSVVFLGVAFIATLVVVAMLALATGPVGAETDLDGRSVHPDAENDDEGPRFH